MKKLFLILILFLTFNQSYSYTWESFGPEGIKASNLFFLWQDDVAPLIIFSDSGMFFYDNGLVTWQYYAYPAKEAVQQNNNTLLFVAGDGSYSDGIYSFSLQTHEIEVVEYCINPAFIKYYDQTGLYWVGYESGLLKSENGSDWEAVDYFNGKNCVGMEFTGDHIVVNVLADLTHLYLSDNSGVSWTEATGCPGWFTGMAFREDGKFFGVFPDNSYSSGLWSSDDYGDNWDVEFYSVDMNAVGTADGESFIMLGWTNSVNDYEGIALYDPDLPPPGLTFLNEGLPNKNINKIFYKLQICTGAVLYVCTDNGVYNCWDYFVGINEQAVQKTSVSIYPNPVTTETVIKIISSEATDYISTIEIINNQGEKVDEIKPENSYSKEFEIKWSKGNLPAGVYYLLIETEKESWSEKFVIL